MSGSIFIASYKQQVLVNKEPLIDALQLQSEQKSECDFRNDDNHSLVVYLQLCQTVQPQCCMNLLKGVTFWFHRRHFYCKIQSDWQIWSEIPCCDLIAGCMSPAHLCGTHARTPEPLFIQLCDWDLWSRVLCTHWRGVGEERLWRQDDLPHSSNLVYL